MNSESADDSDELVQSELPQFFSYRKRRDPFRMLESNDQPWRGRLFRDERLQSVDEAVQVLAPLPVAPARTVILPVRGPISKVVDDSVKKQTRSEAGDSIDDGVADSGILRGELLEEVSELKGNWARCGRRVDVNEGRRNARGKEAFKLKQILFLADEARRHFSSHCWFDEVQRRMKIDVRLPVYRGAIPISPGPHRR